jgi:1-aminocyclopropane-1-carboxylate synthase
MCVDLSSFLTSPTWDGERQLFVKLFDCARVLITPGKDLHFAQPGWFRICFAMYAVEDVVQGIHSIAGALKQ